MTATMTADGAMNAMPREPMSVAPRRDPQRTAMAAIITFVVVIIGLWAMLSYLHAMSVTLSQLDSGNAKLHRQLVVANVNLAALEHKTAYVPVMAKDTTRLKLMMGGINQELGGMVSDVDTINTQMTSMNTTLTTLNTDVKSVGEANAAVGQKLGAINTGLKSEVSQVAGMRKDVKASAVVLNKVPPQLQATNDRLGFVNSVVCQMGTTGVNSGATVHITFLGIPNGSANIKATVIPPGGWTC